MGQIENERDERGILTLWLHNPGRLNALSNSMVAALCAAFSQAAADPSLRAVVLRGRGGVFCAGRDLNDLKALQEAPPADIARMYDLMEEMNRVIVGSGAPVIAAVEGHALGIATMLVTWADIAIGASTASLGYPEVRHGIVPYGAVPTMISSMPKKAVLDLLLTGRKVDAEEAVRLGILTEVVAPDRLDDRLNEVLETILCGKRDAQIRIKRFLRDCEGLTWDAAVSAATRHAKAGTGRGSEASAGMASFLAKQT